MKNDRKPNEMNEDILIIDDTLENLEFLLDLLVKEGYATRVAQDGRTALSSIRKKLPGLILLDIKMPDIDGYEICRQLKADTRSCEIPIVFLSALHDTSEKVKAFSLGGVDFITKPFQVEEVLVRIRTHLSIQQLRRELQAQNERLQQEILEREQAEEARRRIERELYRSQRLEALGTLAGGIAHDFNNILGTMLGYTELLLDAPGIDRPTQESYLQEVFTAGTRAKELVHRVLIFSRAQEEQALVPTDILPVIHDVLSLLRATAPADVTFERRLPESCPRIAADASQLHRMLLNLCVNAVHAMEEDGGVLGVDVNTGSDYIQLRVSDTGAGMPPEIQNRIFEPFFTTKDVGQGIGLGLSVVHGIVKRHHAKLALESTPGRGTTFSLHFPLSGENAVEGEQK